MNPFAKPKKTSGFIASCHLAVAMGLLVISAAAQASGGGASLNVSATVLPYTRVQLVSAPENISITRKDVDQGFVDVEVPMSFTVRTNRADGAMVMLTSMSEFVEQTAVSGLHNPVLVSRHGGVLTVPTPGAGRDAALTLRFRLFLAKATPPGTHAWPIRVSNQVL